MAQNPPLLVSGGALARGWHIELPTTLASAKAATTISHHQSSLFVPSKDTKITSLCWSAEGLLLAVITSKGLFLVSAKGEILKSIPSGNEHQIRTAAFLKASPRYLTFGGTEKSVRFWDAKKDEAIRMLKGHSGTVNSIDISGDDRRCAVGTSSGGVGVYSMKDGVYTSLASPFKESVNKVAFSPIRKSMLFAVGDEGFVVLWDVDRKAEPLQIHKPAHAGPVRGLELTRANIMCTVGLDKMAQFYDIALKRIVHSVNLKAPVMSCTSLGGHIFAFGLANGVIVIYDIRLRKHIDTLQSSSEQSPIEALAFQPSLDGESKPSKESIFGSRSKDAASTTGGNPKTTVSTDRTRRALSTRDAENPPPVSNLKTNELMSMFSPVKSVTRNEPTRSHPVDSTDKLQASRAISALTNRSTTGTTGSEKPARRAVSATAEALLAEARSKVQSARTTKNEQLQDSRNLENKQSTSPQRRAPPSQTNSNRGPSPPSEKSPPRVTSTGTGSRFSAGTSSSKNEDLESKLARLQASMTPGQNDEVMNMFSPIAAKSQHSTSRRATPESTSRSPPASSLHPNSHISGSLAEKDTQRLPLASTTVPQPGHVQDPFAVGHDSNGSSEARRSATLLRGETGAKWAELKVDPASISQYDLQRFPSNNEGRPVHNRPEIPDEFREMSNAKRVEPSPEPQVPLGRNQPNREGPAARFPTSDVFEDGRIAKDSLRDQPRRPTSVGEPSTGRHQDRDLRRATGSPPVGNNPEVAKFAGSTKGRPHSGSSDEHLPDARTTTTADFCGWVQREALDSVRILSNSDAALRSKSPPAAVPYRSVPLGNYHPHRVEDAIAKRGSSSLTPTTKSPVRQPPAVSAPPSFQHQMLQSIVNDCLEDFREQLRADVRNMHVDLLRQFWIQKTEVEDLFRRYSPNETLLQENRRLREDNERLRCTY